MRILLVSQMYPGPADPDLGVFVRGLEEQLTVRGHHVERAVLDRRAGGKRRYLELARDTLATSSPRTGATCATSERFPASARRPLSSSAALRP